MSDDKHSKSAGDVPCLSTSVSRVVVSVLRAGSAVQINQNFETVVSSPADGLVEVGGLALDVRFAAGDIVGPETDRNSDVVKTGSWCVSAHP